MKAITAIGIIFAIVAMLVSATMEGTAIPAFFVIPAYLIVLAGTAGSDVVTWSSPDGRSWRAERPHGLGLDGPGVQQLHGMTVVGGDLLAVGFTGDHRTDGPTLWRRPLP